MILMLITVINYGSEMVRKTDEQVVEEDNGRYISDTAELGSSQAAIRTWYLRHSINSGGKLLSLRAAHSMSIRSLPKTFGGKLHTLRTIFPWLLRSCTSICVTGPNAVDSWTPSLASPGLYVYGA